MKLVFLRLAQRNLLERIPGRKGVSSAWRKRTGEAVKNKDGV